MKNPFALIAPTAELTTRALAVATLLVAGITTSCVSVDQPRSAPAPAAVAAAPKTTAAPAAVAEREPDVIYVPTPQAVVDKMLEMAEVKPGDVVYDLGCGDGRIVVTAAKKYGVKAIGFDIDPQRIAEAQENVRSNGVGHLVTIRQEDIFTLDLREATVVTLYLLPELNVRLMPQLEKLRPGSRIVSHDFDMRGAKPVAVVKMPAGNDSELEGTDPTIYKWVVPWKSE
jgi:SAM-dependent methyltransferase